MAYIYTKRECCKSARNILFPNDSLLWKRRCLSLNFKKKRKKRKRKIKVNRDEEEEEKKRDEINVEPV